MLPDEAIVTTFGLVGKILKERRSKKRPPKKPRRQPLNLAKGAGRWAVSSLMRLRWGPRAPDPGAGLPNRHIPPLLSWEHSVSKSLARTVRSNLFETAGTKLRFPRRIPPTLVPVPCNGSGRQPATSIAMLLTSQASSNPMITAVVSKDMVVKGPLSHNTMPAERA